MLGASINYEILKFQESWEDEDEDEKKDEEKANGTPSKSKPKVSIKQKIAEKEVNLRIKCMKLIF